MAGNGIDHVIRFTEAAEDVRSDERMRAFDFVVDGLADVVEQAGAFGSRDIEVEFGGEQTGEMGDLDGMIEDILRKAVTEPEASEEFRNLRMERGQAGAMDGFLAEADD